MQRKPEGIGVEMKALADGMSGILIKLEVMEGADAMKKKEYSIGGEHNAGTRFIIASDQINNTWRVLIADSAFGSVAALK